MKRKTWTRLSPEMAYLVVREYGRFGPFRVIERRDWGGGPIHGYAATRKKALWILDDLLTLELMDAREAEALEARAKAREARLVALGFELPSDEQRAQNIREITDHFCQGGFLP